MPRLAIVGASARAAAMSAMRAGFDVVAADLFADEDLRLFCPATQIADYPKGLADWLANQQVDGWLYTGALENHPDLVDEMARLKPLVGNPGQVLRRVRSPWQLAEVVQSCGTGVSPVEGHGQDARATRFALLFPETRATADGLPLNGTWLCKTYRGSSGSGVWPLDGDAAACRAQIDEAVFQKRIEGVPLAAVYVADTSNAQLLGVTRQLVGAAWTGAGPFQYCGSISLFPPLDGEGLREGCLIDKLTTLGSALAKSFQLRGPFGVDLVLSGEELYVVEVNPRYTASVEVIERATGVQAIARYLEMGGWGRVPTRRDEPPASCPCQGKAILFAKRDVVVSAQFTDWAIQQAGNTDNYRLADVPAAGMKIAKGRPVITVFAEGDAPETVSASLQEWLAEVEARLD